MGQSGSVLSIRLAYHKLSVGGGGGGGRGSGSKGKVCEGQERPSP